MKKALTLLLICLTLLANAQSSFNMNLLGTYDYPTTQGNDIWGWVDASGNEYALVGLKNGFSCVDVTNPATPLEKFFISDLYSTWRDVKTWGNYAYITTEANAGLLIVDLTDMSGNTFSHVTQFMNSNGVSVPFTSAHDIYIDEHGIAYIFGAKNNGSYVANGGAIFLDLAVNPINPVYLGEWSDEYIHDGMVRGDTMYAGCVYAGKLFIVDVSDKTNPTTLGSATTPNAFTHNAWVSDDGNYVFTTDEKSDAYLGAFDISNLNNIQEVDRIQSNPGSNSIPHNTFVDGNFLITSYYRDGTTVHDITYPNNMIQVAYYDSYSGSGNGFDGCWGTYPYLPSGNIISSDINSGAGGKGRLLIYGRDFQQASFLSGTVTNANTGSPINNADIEIVATSYTTTTNLLGDYTLGSVNSGVFQVLFSASGYIPSTLNVTLSSGNITILDAALFIVGSLPGCTDSTAFNYDPLAIIDDGSCFYCNITTNIISSSVNCTGLCDGSATAFVNGGTPPYTYLWDDPLLQNTPTITNLCAGPYTCTVIDVNGCEIAETTIVEEPIAIFASIAVNPVSCFGANDGSIFVIATGGVLPYQYSLAGGLSQSNGTFTGLLPGAYSVDVTDANGCMILQTVVINEPTQLQIEIIDSLTVYSYCSGINSGQLCAIASGGTLPYNYLWNDILAQTTSCATNLIADQYTVTVQDNNNCIASISYNLDSITNIMIPQNVNMTIVDASCFGGYNGSVTINSVGGGVPPFSYSWFPAVGTTNAITSLYAQSYAVVITDSLGCEVTVNAQVGQPDELTYTTSNVIGETCFGACEGQIWVDVQGGTAPYYYDDSQSNSFPIASANQVQLVNDSIILGLCTGLNSIYITDANNCEAALDAGGTFQEVVDSGIVVTVSLAVTSNYNGFDVSCYNACDGSALVSVSGGAPPYTYLWDDPLLQNTVTAIGLCADTYTCTVTEANGCSQTSNSGIITEPPGLSFSIVSNNVSCFGANDGEIIVAATGGVLPYQYSLGGGLSQSNGTFSGLSAGTYSVDVTDVNGCMIFQTIVINEPNPLFVNAFLTDISCFGYCDGSAFSMPSGGTPPYSYLWSNGNITDNISGLCAGVYIVNITDDNNCVNIETVVIVEPTALSISVDSTNETSAFNDGSATATVLGGTPGYIYMWNTTPPQTTNLATNLAPGLYTVTVTDATGCTMSGTTSVNAYNTTGIINIKNTSKTLMKVTDVLGRETKGKMNQPLIYIYDDGTVEKRIVIE